MAAAAGPIAIAQTDTRRLTPTGCFAVDPFLDTADCIEEDPRGDNGAVEAD